MKTEEYYVCRGGSWYNYNPTTFRGAFRDYYAPPDIRNFGLGFRVAIIEEVE